MGVLDVFKLLTLVLLMSMCCTALKHSPSKKRSGIAVNLPLSPPASSVAAPGTTSLATTQVPVHHQASQLQQSQDADKKSSTHIESSANPESSTVDVSSVHVGGKYLLHFCLVYYCHVP